MRKAPADSPAVSPGSKPDSTEEMYDDANVTAAQYPAVDAPSPRTRDRLTAESHWRAICSQLTSTDHLAKPFVE